MDRDEVPGDKRLSVVLISFKVGVYLHGHPKSTRGGRQGVKYEERRLFLIGAGW